jgi:hypothetical protein
VPSFILSGAPFFHPSRTKLGQECGLTSFDFKSPFRIGENRWDDLRQRAPQAGQNHQAEAGMIRIAKAAFEAIAKTLPLGSIGYKNATTKRGERLTDWSGLSRVS